jgi:hypothetical protein
VRTGLSLIHEGEKRKTITYVRVILGFVFVLRVTTIVSVLHASAVCIHVSTVVDDRLGAESEMPRIKEFTSSLKNEVLWKTCC